MATTKIATLVIRTLAKPISIRLKDQARQHDRFRTLCVSLAQFMYRTEVRLRTNILGADRHHTGSAGGKQHHQAIRPLSEAKAIENGANLLAEGFLFAVAAALIVGETWRSSRREGRRREGVVGQLEELTERLARLEDEGRDTRERTAELARILDRVVVLGMSNRKADVEVDVPPQRVTIQAELLVAPPPPNLSNLLRILGENDGTKEKEEEARIEIHEPPPYQRT